MGGVGQVACKVSWLGKLTSVFWWVELDLFCLECSEVPSSEFEVSLGLVCLLATCIFVLKSYVPALLENLHGMSCSEIGWPLGGAWFQCRYGGFWISFC